MENCKICEMLKNPEIRHVYDSPNKDISVILNPKLSPHLGRLAVIPTHHFETISETVKANLSIPGKKYIEKPIKYAGLIEEALYIAFQPKDVWVFNKGKSSGHFHLDLVPIYDLSQITYDLSEEQDDIKKQITFDLNEDARDGILLRSYHNAPLIPKQMKKGLEDKLTEVVKELTSFI